MTAPDAATATDLTAWLSARYDAAEQRARAATPGPWHVGERDPEDVDDGSGWSLFAPGRTHPRIPTAVVSALGCCEKGGVWKRPDAAHIADLDPSWRLADIELKRQILAEHPPTRGWDGDNLDGPICHQCAGTDISGGLEGDPYPCRTVRLLAAEFADADGYDSERWGP